jgi:hypothetical protein
MSSTTGLTILSAREEENNKIKKEEDNDWYNITKLYYK